MERATIELMLTSGGSFARALAAAWLAADPTNRQRLEAAFADFFERYAGFAASTAKEAA